MKIENPFSVVGYNGPDTFCDRVRETQKLRGALENGRNVTLIAPRRYGKTGLLHHVLGQMKDSQTPIYLDIFALHNLTEFTSAFAAAVVGQLDSTVEKAFANLGKFFRSCRPTVTPQADGSPQFSFDLSPRETEATLKDVFAYLKAKDRPVVIAIDEFQQILEFPERGTEALLRGYVQAVSWVRFVFAGSRHHLMGEMFLSAKHPFYQSTDILSLDVIPCDVYADFAKRHFSAAGQPFKEEVFGTLYARFGGVTWYVQSLLNRIWQTGEGLVRREQIEEVVSDLVADRELLFRDLYFSRTESERHLLKAIADARVVAAPYAGDFIQRHGLTATSSVRTALKSLTEGDLVYRSEKGYIVYDFIFDEWLRKAIP